MCTVGKIQVRDREKEREGRQREREVVLRRKAGISTYYMKEEYALRLSLNDMDENTLCISS